MQRWRRIDSQLDQLGRRIDRLDQAVRYFEVANSRLAALADRLEINEPVAPATPPAAPGAKACLRASRRAR